MTIYPAIDLFEGKVVRLARGDYSQMTVYSQEPPEVARRWESQGAAWLHIVDLEGARAGEPKNVGILRKIREAVGCRIQFGGGLRSVESIRRVLGEGIDRVIVGTKALDENFLAQVVETFGDQLAVSLDVKDGRVQTRGWLECADQTLTEVLAGLNRFQLDTLVYTDTQKDGMLRGPNLAEFGKVLEMTRSKVILAGGISGLNDIRQCRQMVNGNFDGVIVGKALFQDDFSLTEALRIANQQEDLR